MDFIKFLPIFFIGFLSIAAFIFLLFLAFVCIAMYDDWSLSTKNKKIDKSLKNIFIASLVFLSVVPVLNIIVALGALAILNNVK